MFIREFSPDDLKRVYEIEVESFSNPYEINILQQLHEIGAGFLVAIENGDVVGYIIFWIKVEGQGHIISLAVDNDYKRQHIATRLLSMAVNVFRNCDIFRVNLEVKTHNEAAVTFYKHFGFILDRMVPGYYEDGSDAYVMYLESNALSN